MPEPSGDETGEIQEHVAEPDATGTMSPVAAASDETRGMPLASKSDPRASIPVGASIANRYRMRRFIAAGGMGEVYEVDDLQLSTRVALKTIRAARSEDPDAILRFRREIQLAQRVTHENVSRIFDLGVDRAGLRDETLFLTMELLMGETLADVLRRGPLTTELALPIVKQLIAGLAAIHRADIVHRDLKPLNIILEPRSLGTAAEVRVVVTDFGLARGPLEGSLSLAHPAGGTPHYMAPEQVEGERATPATDVYALGVVLFEMVTGQRPFSGENAFEVANKRLTQIPARPRDIVPNLDQRWNDAILRCLARKPADRFPDVSSVAIALTGEQTGGPPTIPSPTRRRWFVGVGVSAVAGAVVAQIWTRNWSRTRSSAIRPAIAILGFKNLAQGAATAWLSTAFAEMLLSEMVAGDALRAVPGATVARAKRDLLFEDAETITSDVLDRLRKSLHADYVVSGAYLISGGQLRFDVRLQDSTTAQLLGVASATGTEADLFGMVARVGARLRQALGLESVTPGRGRAALPTDPEAARLYAVGLEKLARLDGSDAKTAFEAALKREPQHPFLRAAYADSWAMLGYDVRARDETQKAVEMAGALTREEQLVLQARLYERKHDWPQATKAYGELVTLYPDELEYGLSLARAQSRTDTTMALATVERLRGLSGTAGADPRIDIAEAEISEVSSDWRREEFAAVRAAERGDALSARGLVARAKILEARSLASQGKFAAADAALDIADREFRASGDQAGIALVLNRRSHVFVPQARYAEARVALEQSLVIYRKIGDRRGEGSVLNNLAVVARVLGQLSTSRTLFLKAWDVNLEIGEPSITPLFNAAVVLAAEGRMVESEQAFIEAAQRALALGQRTVSAECLKGLGDIALARGQLALARDHFSKAEEQFRELGEQGPIATTLSAMGEVQLWQGNLDAAQESQQQAMTIRKTIDSDQTLDDSRVALAHLALWRGKWAEAERLAREAAGRLLAAGRRDAAGHAWSIVARSLAESGSTAAATAALDTATDLAGGSAEVQIRFAVAMSKASVLRAAGHREAALQKLTHTQQEADVIGLKLFVLQALTESAVVTCSGSGDRAADIGAAARRQTLGAGFTTLVRRIDATCAKALPRPSPGV